MEIETKINLYQIIDIILKILAGIILVAYINRRNNVGKKRDFLYQAYIDLQKNKSNISSNYYAYNCYRIFHSLHFINKFHLNDENLDYLEKKASEYEEKWKIVKINRDEFFIKMEIINSILSIDVNKPKFKNLIDGCDETLLNNLSIKINDDLKEQILFNLDLYFKGLLTFNEMESFNDMKITENVKNFKAKNITEYQNEIIKRIEKL